MPISDLKPGEDYVGFARIHMAEAKTTSAGKPFAAYTLQDKTGSVRTNCWDAKPEDLLPVGTLVKFRGQGEIYNGSLQLRLDSTRFRPVEPRDHLLPEDVLPAAPESPEAMLQEIRDTIAAMTDESIRTLTQTIIDEVADQILRFPAAQSMHHAEVGGLLHHSTSMLRAAKALCPLYPFLRTDLLFAGIILHDIGKIDEMNLDPSGLVSGYTPQGRLLGHIHMGAARIAHTAFLIGTPPETTHLLQHMILAHHGKPEWGSPIPTLFPEAEVLATLDLLDARLYEMKEALDKTAPGSFSEKVYALDNRTLYNPTTSHSPSHTPLD